MDNAHAFLAEQGYIEHRSIRALGSGSAQSDVTYWSCEMCTGFSDPEEGPDGIHHESDCPTPALARGWEAERLLKEATTALQDLSDVQNGPPLVKYEHDWNAAMAKALEAVLIATAFLAEAERYEARAVVT